MDRVVEIQPDENPKGQPNVKSFLWELARVIIIAFIVMVGFRFLIAEPFIVSGSSMVPNYHNREYLIVNKLDYKTGEPERGDVVVFRYPKDNSQYFIKRIVGMPGEKVKIQGGKVIIINQQYPEGKVLEEPYLPNQNVTFGSEDTVTLGSSEYYVLGDNRLASSDSRVWGILPKHDIIGKAWLRVFPLNTFGITEFPDPSFAN